MFSPLQMLDEQAGVKESHLATHSPFVSYLLNAFAITLTVGLRVVQFIGVVWLGHWKPEQQNRWVCHDPPHNLSPIVSCVLLSLVK
jgi:hypothetical protein